MLKKFLTVICFALALLMLGSCGTETPPAAGTTDGAVTTEPAPDTTEPVTEAPKPVEKVIFIDGVNGNDDNDGLTEATAVLTYKAAFELLAEDRERIVIVNSVKMGLNEELPKYNGTVIFTTVHNGVNYGEKNSAVFRMGYVLSLNCDTVFENINIRATGAGANLCFNFHNFTIGENVDVVSTSSRNINLVVGYNVEDTSLKVDPRYTARTVSHTGDITVNVYSGKWNAFIGGNFREGYFSPVGTYNGNMTVNIGGTAEFLSTARADDIEGLGVSAAGHNYSKGSVTLNISGGVIKCPVYGIGKIGRYYNFTGDTDKKGTDGTQFGRDVRFEANVTLNISGGDFTADNASVINALQVPGDTSAYGSYTVNVTGGNFNGGLTFGAFGMLGKTAITGVDAAKAQHFDSVNGTATNYERPLRIACCGDSITFGTCATDANENGYLYAKENFYYPNQMQKMYGTDAVVGNFGYPGSYVGANYNRYLNSCVYNALIQFDPDVIVLALGTNNAALMPDGKSGFITYYRTMLNDMHKRFPEAKIIMTTALYRWDNAERTQQVDQYIIPVQKQMAEEFKDFVVLYDANTEYKPYGNTTYYRDKLHPNNAGYVKLAEVMKKGVDQLIGGGK
ncbi:MAG: hypothetical protein E7619_09115 [Ruminococcaceae bacterium]|nr:hypothetical protein [Oscillospiraceae bacterium]